MLETAQNTTKITKYLLVVLVVLILVLLGLNLALSRYGAFWEKKSRFGLSCPAPKEFCSKGKKITLGGRYVGVGYLLPAGTSFLAAMNGELRYGHVVMNPEYGGETFQTVSVLNGRDHLIYTYSGNPEYRTGMVSKGEPIGKVDQRLSPYGEVNLLFLYEKGGKPVEISSKDFD
ncbi:MAG: hypothetical protein H5T64_11000 [Chloroflexi bacterium]|nr:hypothetical protein [Chloroflexota bacterium]